MRVLPHPSPNHGPRRGGARPRLVVLHATCMHSHAAALARLCDPQAEVSAHYLISETGQTLALVPEDRRAWHAGAGAWQGCADVNSASIGIELSNTGAQPFALPQITALEQLLAEIRARWTLPRCAVIAHSDMAPGRKADPGARLDWRGLALAGQSIWPEPTPAGQTDAPALGDSLTRIGYPDAPPEARLAAFRLRFRPAARGPETEADRRLAAQVAALVLPARL